MASKLLVGGALLGSGCLVAGGLVLETQPAATETDDLAATTGGSSGLDEPVTTGSSTSTLTTDSAGWTTAVEVPGSTSASTGAVVETTDAAHCGDGSVDVDEQCDDGNAVQSDGCSNTCVAPRRVFVSSSTFYGDLGGPLGRLTGGLALADARCQELADDAGIAAIFRAWLSATGQSPATRFDTEFTGAYQTVDGTLIAAFGWPDLTDGSLEHPIDRDELGMLVETVPYVWTNTTQAGDIAGGDHCVAWSTKLDNARGSIGSILEVGIQWTDDIDLPTCDTRYRLYCFEQ